MKRSEPVTTRVLYAPQPFNSYCPEVSPDRCMLWHAVPGGTDNDIGAARWNMIWLATPEMDNVLDFDRQPGPVWQSVKPDLTLAVLVPIWPELRHAAVCEPSILKIWLNRHRNDLLLTGASASLPIVFRRLDEAIARRAHRGALPRAGVTRTEGNVMFVDFKARHAERTGT